MADINGPGPIRVLWVAKGLGPGGMEQLLVNHARVGDRSAFEYSAAYLVNRPHSVVPALEDLGVRCFKLGDGRDVDLRWARELRSLVRELGVNVVHVHSPMVAAVARPALRSMRGRPAIVYTEHNSWDCYSLPTRVLNAVTYPLDDSQLAVSSAAAASAIGPLKRRVEVLTHGIDLDAVQVERGRAGAIRAELGIAPDAIVVVTVANLRSEKAYDVLLDAAAIAGAARSDVVFLSVGQGPLRDDLERQHSKLGLGDQFRFLGFRDDVQDLLSAADLFCFSSRHEGLPVALMEAYAVGLPVVGTNVGGLPDVIEHGGSGLLVEAEDATALAEAVLTLAADSDLRARMSRRAIELAERFDCRVSVKRLESLYSELAR